jgi:hypothetical protein
MDATRALPLITQAANALKSVTLKPAVGFYSVTTATYLFLEKCAHTRKATAFFEKRPRLDRYKQFSMAVVAAGVGVLTNGLTVKALTKLASVTGITGGYAMSAVTAIAIVVTYVFYRTYKNALQRINTAIAERNDATNAIVNAGGAAVDRYKAENTKKELELLTREDGVKKKESELLTREDGVKKKESELLTREDGVKKKEQDVDSRNGQLDTISAGQSAREEALAKKELAVAQVEADIATAKDELAKLKQESEAKANSLADREQLLKAKEEDLAASEKQLYEVLSIQSKEHDTIIKNFEFNGKERGLLAKERESLEEEKQKLAQERTKFEEDKNASSEEGEKLAKALKEQTDQLNQVTKLLSDLEGNVTRTLEAAEAKHATQVEVIQRDLEVYKKAALNAESEKETAIADLKNQLGDQEAAHKEYETKLAAEIHLHTAKNKDLQGLFEETCKRSVAYQQKADGLKTQLDTLSNTTKPLNDKIAELESAAIAYPQKLHEKDLEIAELKKELEKLKAAQQQA